MMKAEFDCHERAIKQAAKALEREILLAARAGLCVSLIQHKYTNELTAVVSEHPPEVEAHLGWADLWRKLLGR